MIFTIKIEFQLIMIPQGSSTFLLKYCIDPLFIIFIFAFKVIHLKIYLPPTLIFLLFYSFLVYTLIVFFCFSNFFTKLTLIHFIFVIYFFL